MKLNWILVLVCLVLGVGMSREQRSLGCYRRPPHRLRVASYQEANHTCCSMEGHLPSLHSSNENEFVAELLKAGGYSRGWLGVRVAGVGEVINRWDDGSPFHFTNWGHHNSNASSSPMCSSLSSLGHWEVVSCDTRMGYLCKFAERHCRIFMIHDSHRKKRDTNDHRFFQRINEWSENYYFGVNHRAFEEYMHDRSTTLVPTPQLLDQTHRFSYIDPVNSSIADNQEPSQISPPEDSSALEMNHSDSQLPFFGIIPTITVYNNSQPTIVPTTRPHTFPQHIVYPFGWTTTQAPDLQETTSESPSTEPQDAATPKSPSSATVASSPKKCLGDEVMYGRWCYRLMSFYPTTWWNAKKICHNHNGRLALLDDRLIAEHLNRLSTNVTLAWFGLSWNNDTQGFSWVSGEPLNFTNWYHLEDDGGSYNVCVAVQLGERLHVGTWVKQNCSLRYRFICQYEVNSHMITTEASPPTTTTTTTTTTTSTTTMPTTPSNVSCATDWMEVMDNCYELFSQPLTWEVAERMCATFGAHLLSLSNQEEDVLLQWLMTMERGRFFLEPIWVGLRLGNNSEYEWLDGSTFKKLAWAHGEPNTHNGLEQCVTVLPNNYEFSTAVCVISLPFICEAPKGMPRTTLAPPTPTPDLVCLDNIPLYPSQDNSTWFLYDGFCYKFVGSELNEGQEPLTWWESHLRCRQEGGHLASIHSLEENYWIMSKLPALDTDIVWIGGRALVDTGYSWLDDTPFDFVNWREGEPNNIFDQEDCIGMFTRQQGYWNDQNCAVREGRVCKRLHGFFHQPVQPTQLPRGHCPPGWISTETKCFKIFKDIVNIESAIVACKNLSVNGNLASIHSDIEQAYLTSAMGMMNDSVWLGLKNHESKFYWMDQTVMTYTNWALGEPSGMAVNEAWVRLLEDCVEMLPFHEAGRWNNHGCNFKRGYVCQQPIDPLLSSATSRPACHPPLDHYTSYGEECYRVISTPAMWKDAEETCLAEGGHLVSVNTVSEAATVWVLLMEAHLEDAWLGLAYHQEREVFKWSSGWFALYTNWGAREPTRNDSHSHCTKINATDGFWYTESCSLAKPYICKFKDENVPTPDPPLDGTCPDRVWYDFGGTFCYLIVHDVMPWKDANMWCLRENSDLVSIHSEQENFFLQKAAHTIKDTFWIGLLHKKDNYGWSDGSGLGLVRWAPGEPTAGDESCVEMYVSTGRWNNIYCSNARSFICKIYKIGVPVRQHHLTAAGTAGITLALVVVVMVAVLVAGYVYRKTLRPPKIDGVYSFDNALYSADESRTCEVIDEATLHFLSSDPVDSEL